MTLWNDRPEAWHEILPGVKRILAHGDGVMVVLLEIAPKTSLPNHTHPHAQAGTFLEGEGVFYVGNETYRMRKGSAYSIPGGVPHGLLTARKGRASSSTCSSPNDRTSSGKRSQRTRSEPVAYPTDLRSPPSTGRRAPLT